MQRLSALSRRVRNAMYQLHLWTGLILGLWFSYIGVTGSVLAWLPDLLPYEFTARYPYERRGDAPIIPPSRAIAAMRAAYPTAKPEELNTFTYPSSNGFPYYIWGIPGRTDRYDDRFVLVDPYSGKVHPSLRVPDLTLGFIATSHSNLMLSSKGLITNSVFMAFGLIMLGTGIWVWWPVTIRQLRRSLLFVRGTSLFRTLYDLHNIMGIYLFVILFATTLTGLLVAVDQLTDNGLEQRLDRIAGTPEPAPPSVAAAGTPLPIDSLFTLAQRAVGTGEIIYMAYPTTPDGAYRAAFRNTGMGLLMGGDITIDPYTGKVLEITSDRDGSFGHVIMHLSGDLHFGTFGGAWSKILYTLAGLTPLGLFITGAWRWWIRKPRRKARTAAGESTELAAMKEIPG